MNKATAGTRTRMPMRILLATSELNPYSKSGGLADMVAALAKSLGAAGHQVGVVTPLYRGIRDSHTDLEKTEYTLSLPLGPDTVEAGVWTVQPHPGVTIYFVDQPGFYDRASLYQENGADYGDNARRFTFFSKCVTHMARHLPWHPEIVHLHDWQTGLVPLMVQHQKLTEGWGSAPATVLTIHNLAYQGVFPAEHYRWSNLPWEYFNPNGAEFYGLLNCMKTGLCHADALTTVSPRYAREITTPEFGCNLDGVLRDRQTKLVGILNGVDYEEWSTQDNPHLAASYTARDLAGKAVNKMALQKELGLTPRPDAPLFASITRLTDQKGIDILLGALTEMLAADIQFVQLGSGHPRFESAAEALGRRFRDRASVMLGFNPGLSHRIEAGADFFLMPSRFEPCGLNQLYSLRYGTVPVVRTTGGLDDTVVDAREDARRATGIKFQEYSVRALSKSIRKAMALYGDASWLGRFRRNGMAADFGLDHTREKYEEVYRRVIF